MKDQNEQWYRTGAVAKLLNTSSHKIRALARAGLIDSQERNGNLYIPSREVDRLKAEGLPPMPASADVISEDSEPDEENLRPARTRGATAGLYGEPSPQLIRSKERLLEAEHNDQLRGMLRSRKEEEGRAQRGQQIERWRERYRRMAAVEAHGEVLVDLLRRVDQLLDTAPPFTDLSTQVRQLIEAAMRPIKEREEQKRALEKYRQRIDREVQSITRGRLGLYAEKDEVEEAQDLARSALSEHSPEASDGQVRAVLQRAIAPITQRIAQRRAQRERANDIKFRLVMLPTLPHSTKEANDRLTREARSALEGLPLSATSADLDAAVDRVAGPFRVADQKAREAAAATRDAKMRWSILLAREVDARLGQLEQRGDLEFEGFVDRFNLCRDLERKIEPLIIAEIVNDPSLSDSHLRRRVAALTDRHHKEFCK